MNKQTYRVIFSKTLNRMIVVSELAKTCGKAASENLGIEKTLQNLTALYSSLNRHSSLHWTIKPLQFSLFLALGYVSFSPVAMADEMAVRADKSAPATQQATILKTANGLPQVNIQTPSPAGVSRNTYSQFDVAEKGAVLNNARKATQTQIAGWVQGNPNLATGEAKVILNEVNSTNPSRLKGYIEVAGKKADVVIANPSGIHCDGCGVINAGRSTLTTGKPEMENGELKGYHVKGGKVNIAGKGLDNRQADYTDIIAEKVKVEGGVWAKNLKVTTGKNKVNRTNDAVVYVGDKNNEKNDRTLTTPETAEATQTYRVDVSELGGMYAERIQLVDNGTGLGVRNAGHIGASVGEVQIDSQGRIVNQGQVQAKQQIGITSDDNIDNRVAAKVVSQENHIQLKSKQTINQSGVVATRAAVKINARSIEQTKQGEIQGGQVTFDVSEHLVNRGLINGLSTGDTAAEILIKAGTITNVGTGRIYGGHTALQANKIINSDELQDDGTINSAVIAATQRLDIAAPQIENSKTIFTQDWAFNGIGGTLASEGKIVFGKTLDANHQAQGLSDILINRGGLIEGNGIQFGVKQLNNENARLRTNLEEVSNQAVNKHYLIVDDPKIGERIDFDQLRWISFSRAGKVIYKNKIIPLRPQDGNITGYILPTPNEETCVDEQTRTGCVPVPQGIYTNQDPVWAAFHINPPETPAPKLPDLSGLASTLTEPVEPTKPIRRFSNRNGYEQELKDYEAKMVEYRKAMAEYEAKLIAYSAEMKPYLDWVNTNAEKFEQLDAAIQKHNARLLGREFSRFWDVYVTQRIERQTKVKETHPGKILSGGDIDFSGEVENNRSQIIAAGVIHNTADPVKRINNIEEIGMTQIDDIGNQEWTYSRWRGGFKRYYQREWTGRHAHRRRTETPLPLNLAQVESYSALYASMQQNENEIRHIQANISLPISSLYRIHPEGQKTLIETDPQFTDRKKWLSSDYMFDALRSEPQNILKRLGDGYYEQRVVRDQINQLTGRMFLDNQQDLETQYKALMDKGISFAKQFHLTPGIALNAEQVAALTSDIVWFEPQTVTLPSGKTVEVIAPRVYVVANKGDLNGEGALISANVIDLRTAHLNNLGTIAGRKIALLNTDTLRNEGTIQGEKVGIKTTGNFDNIGGKVEAERGLFIDVGGDFTHQSTTHRTEVDLSHFKRSETTLARKALLYVKGKEGELHLSANTILSQGADIINEGQGDTIVKAKTGLNLTALSVGFDEKMGKGDHYRNEKVQEAVVSHIKGNGDVLLSGRDITAEGANLESAAHLKAVAENDIVLNGAKESRHFEAFHKTKSGSVAKVTKTCFDQQQSETLVGTQVSGNQVLLTAGNDVKAKGVQAIAENDLQVQAGHDVDIAADTNHFKNIHKETKKTSGVFTSGGGITFGSKSEKHDYQTEGWTQSDARSTLGSMNGNIRIDAGNHANVLGTEMITSRSHQIDLEGTSAKVEAGKDIIETNTKHEYKQSGVTLSVSTPVTDMAQAAYNSLKRSQQVSNPKLKALYAMKAAEETVMAAQNVSKVAETVDALRNGNMQGTGTTASPSVKISIGYGSQKQTQTSETQQIEHQKSTINTGTFNATARSEKLRFEGVEANAALMSLSGKQGIEVKGVKDEEHQRTENKSVGGSVGVFVGTNGNSYGFGIEGSVNVAKGKSNSDSERWQNSHLTAEKVIIHSEAGGLTLDAANLKAKRLEAEVQHLNITSRQDREKYESKQVSAGASGSVAYGSGGGASVNAAYSKAKVDYAQVNEQAGISVGEEGMNIKVHQHTQLNGGVIESEAETSKNHLQTHSISSTDIENHSEIKTESASISAGSGGINPMQALSSALSLLGNRHESSRSHTKSAISQNITIQTKTPENLTALSRDTKNANEQVQKQDLQKVQEQQEMAKVIGEIVDNGISIATFEKREALNKLSLEKFQAEERYGKDSLQAKALGTQMQALQQQLDQEFGLGSEKGMAIRAVTAALQSAVQQDKAGAITALASPYLNREIHKLTEGDSTKEKAANLMAHALLSAVEFQVTGKDPLTGAIAGVTGEATAQYLTKALYNKAPSELTASEKETISSLSQLAGGLAGAFTAKANGSSEKQGGSFLSGMAGAETAKRAVENNYLSSLDVEHFVQELEKAQKEGRDTKPIIEKYQKISAENRQELLACNGNVLCESGHLYQMNAGAEEVERNLGFFSRMTVPYPNNLNENNRILLSTLVEQENANSFNQLSSGTKIGLSAIELGAAIGGTGLITKDSLGKFKLSNANANSKLPVVGKTGNYENQTSKIHISSGAENVALYPKLKEQLMTENLINIGKLDPTLQEVTSKLGSKLDYGIDGMRSVSESNRLGMLWVGENSTEMKERGKVIGLISNDGTRHYRFPADKPKARLSVTKFQSNFETYKIDPISKNRIKIGNAHLDINKE
ncbi:two-partner secretion domain-containing protein [Avibacterium paragallinarum]|uniref:two-partner secretion domain-containing protein n=4 Tax=Avibacterium paragallinarum TaxID=728 RepID=UPI001451D3FA|nr:hemagglutinin repeat-containing protein [Avibacterium paragallinarum]QJE15612.1 filamentous hemagglutinin N-terminal domain-containing protein [Avibacterium paragallinarum]